MRGRAWRFTGAGSRKIARTVGEAARAIAAIGLRGGYCGEMARPRKAVFAIAVAMTLPMGAFTPSSTSL